MVWLHCLKCFSNPRRYIAPTDIADKVAPVSTRPYNSLPKIYTLAYSSLGFGIASTISILLIVNTSSCRYSAFLITLNLSNKNFYSFSSDKVSAFIVSAKCTVFFGLFSSISGAYLLNSTSNASINELNFAKMG